MNPAAAFMAAWRGDPPSVTSSSALWAADGDVAVLKLNDDYEVIYHPSYRGRPSYLLARIDDDFTHQIVAVEDCDGSLRIGCAAGITLEVGYDQ